MKHNISFDYLFSLAKSSWPAVIQIDLELLSHEWADRYTTTNLYEFADSLIDSCHDKDFPVLMKNLHHAIFVSLHRVAPVCKYLNLDAVRSEAIRSTFEENIRPIALGGGIGWNDDDRMDVINYFNENDDAH